MKEKISTDQAPAAVGPYSQAIRAGNLVFCAGQVGIDPKTGELVEGGIEEQTSRVLANVKAVLQAVDLTLDDVVKTTVYLADIGDFAKMNEVYATFFGEPPPARAAFAVKDLPLGALVEIEAVALGY